MQSPFCSFRMKVQRILHAANLQRRQFVGKPDSVTLLRYRTFFPPNSDWQRFESAGVGRDTVGFAAVCNHSWGDWGGTEGLTNWLVHTNTPTFRYAMSVLESHGSRTEHVTFQECVHPDFVPSMRMFYPARRYWTPS